jgi:hypothetical protein
MIDDTVRINVRARIQNNARWMDVMRPGWFADGAKGIPRELAASDSMLIHVEWDRIRARRLYLRELRQRRKLGQTPGTQLEAVARKLAGKPTTKKARLTIRTGSVLTPIKKETSGRQARSRRALAHAIADSIQ